MKQPPRWWAVPADATPPSEQKDLINALVSGLLVPGTYDIYLLQGDLARRPLPALRLARGITLEAGTPTQVPLTTGVRLKAAKDLPQPYAWFVSRAGADITGIVAQSPGGSADPLWLPPGRYDVDWTQEYVTRETPIRIATNVAVGKGEMARIAADSGVVLEIGDGVPKRDPQYGWWGAVRAGEPPESKKFVNFSRTALALLLPPGRYDLYWTQGYKSKPVAFGRGVKVSRGAMVTVGYDGPK